MKKTILNIAIIGMMTGVALAADDKSFFGQIKSLFVKEVVPQVQTQTQTQIAAPQAAMMKAAVMTSATVTATTTNELEDNTANSVDSYTCTDQKKFVNKKIKTEKAIKDQTEDKNKITKSLIKLEASLDTKSAAKIKEKRLQLDAEVKDVTDLEVDIIDIASSTVSIACEDTEKKVVAENIVKIKKLDAQVVVEAEDVTNLIQKDIKILIKNIK